MTMDKRQLSIFISILLISCGQQQSNSTSDLIKKAAPTNENLGYFIDQKENFRIDSLLALDDFNGFNGNIILLDDGKIINKKCLGYANFDAKELLNDSSVFELASCTKQFTGMAIMILAEQGKLDYSDNIQKHIPELPYSNITVENLLTHSSGLPEYGPLMQKYWNTTKTATNYDVVEIIKKVKPKLNCRPDEIFEYCNTGYILLSIIIEKVSRMTYSEFMDKNIFKRLGMNHSVVYSASKNRKINNYAYGYTYSGKSAKYVLAENEGGPLNATWLGGITGDGSIQSTILDLAIWDGALRKNKLVKKNILDKAFSPHILKNGKETDYGFGQFIVRGNKNGKAVYHSGGWPGYRTAILHFIDAKTTIIALSNNEFNNTAKLVGRISLIHLGK